jgi:hypothetical protein
MPHPLVTQLRFARSEFRRGLAGVTEEEGVRRFLPINSISWMVGHLAWQEHRYWLYRGQGRNELRILDNLVGYGAPASTPPLAEMWVAWDKATRLADPYLDALTTADLTSCMMIDGRPHWETIGTMVRRVTYHYFFHTGEALAVRQLLGHTDLPEFVGDIGEEAPYEPEAST